MNVVRMKAEVVKHNGTQYLYIFLNDVKLRLISNQDVNVSCGWERVGYSVSDALCKLENLRTYIFILLPYESD